MLLYSDIHLRNFHIHNQLRDSHNGQGDGASYVQCTRIAICIIITSVQIESAEEQKKNAHKLNNFRAT